MFSIDVDRICGLLNDVTLDLLKLIQDNFYRGWIVRRKLL